MTKGQKYAVVILHAFPWLALLLVWCVLALVVVVAVRLPLSIVRWLARRVIDLVDLALGLLLAGLMATSPATTWGKR